jgi:hypothetical protein
VGDAGIRTTYLGQFEHDHAEKIAAGLEEAQIAWYYKQFGWLTKLLFAGDWGVRLFVDVSRIDEARSIVDRVMADEQGPG